jgi:transposase-like protein
VSFILTASQQQALALISAGSSISDAAHAVGLHRNTLHNWIRSTPDFRQALARAREAAADYWHEQAEQLAPLAIDAIRRLLTQEDTPASVRLKAAQSILAMAMTPPPEPLHNVHNSAQPIARTAAKLGRNELCACGSGRKFKRCCLGKPTSAPLEVKPAA